MKKTDLLTFAGDAYAFVAGVLVTLMCLVALAGCAGIRPAPADALPATAAQLARPNSAALGLPPYLVPAPAGSTPRQRRQWQRAQAQNLARAGVLPTKVKNSSVATAPGAVAITRPASSVAAGAGSVATDARKAGKGHGASAVGPGAVATATSSGPAWWVYLVVAVLVAVGWEVLRQQVPLGNWLPWRTVKR